jgi:hypothetical protein
MNRAEKKRLEALHAITITCALCGPLNTPQKMGDHIYAMRGTTREKVMAEKDAAAKLFVETWEPIVRRHDLLRARDEYEVNQAVSKKDKNTEAFDDIRKSYRRITDESAVIRDRSKHIYNADSAREVLEMLDSIGQTVTSIEGELVKKFPGLKPRRGSN